MLDAQLAVRSMRRAQRAEAKRSRVSLADHSPSYGVGPGAGAPPGPPRPMRRSTYPAGTANVSAGRSVVLILVVVDLVTVGGRFAIICLKRSACSGGIPGILKLVSLD